jgi:ferric-dicitrate binding protein FerR (iron transport regulator)
LLSADTTPQHLSPADRDATIAAMARRLRARRQWRARRAWGGGALAVAASAAALAVSLHRPSSVVPTLAGRELSGDDPGNARAPFVADHVSGGVLVVSKGRANPTRDGAELGTGDHVLTLLDGRATIALPTGTRLAVEGGGDVAVLSEGATQLFELASGALRADVAKLKAGERFVIRTGDAEIEVRGTSFRVATAAADPACGHGLKTRVSVYEGVVTVRTNGADPVALRPGDVWPPGCDDGSAGSPHSAPPPLAPAPPSPLAPAPPPLAPPVEASPAARAPTSDLTAQNDLFDAAMEHERSGDAVAAVAAFDRLMAKYPGGPLAESAALERMKLLSGYDRVRASDAARDYLRRYPRGFGRAEAEAIAR